MNFYVFIEKNLGFVILNNPSYIYNYEDILFFSLFMRNAKINRKGKEGSNLKKVFNTRMDLEDKKESERTTLKKNKIRCEK